MSRSKRLEGCVLETRVVVAAEEEYVKHCYCRDMFKLPVDSEPSEVAMSGLEAQFGEDQRSGVVTDSQKLEQRIGDREDLGLEGCG